MRNLLSRLWEFFATLLPPRPRPPEPPPEPPPDPPPEPPTPKPPEPKPPEPPQPPLPDYPAEVLEMVRLHDAARPGDTQLKLVPELCRAAQVVVDAQQVRGGQITLSHNAGGSPGIRINNAGYRAMQWAENLAYVPGNPGSAETAMRLWLNSSAHKANLMGDWVLDIGVARDDRGIWAAIYAAPAAEGMPFDEPVQVETPFQLVGVGGFDSANSQISACMSWRVVR